MRSRRLASFDDGYFSPIYVPIFSKFIKVATDNVADLINLSNKIEKRFFIFVSSLEDEKKYNENIDLKGGLKGKKEPPPVSRGGRMSLDEAQDTLSKISGTYVLDNFSITLLILSLSHC